MARLSKIPGFPVGFSAANYEPWQGDKEPEELALRLWIAATETDLSDFESVCWAASFDPLIYDALHKWALAQTGLSQAVKARLFDVFIHPRPKLHGGRSISTEGRDRILFQIAQRLVDTYGMNRTQTLPGGSVLCAASVLAKLPGTPAEGQIAGILSRLAKAKSAK